MSEKRILRGCAGASRKSTSISRTKYAPFESKTNEKENYLLHENLKENGHNISDKFIVKSEKLKNQCNQTFKNKKTTKKNDTKKIKLSSKDENSAFYETAHITKCLRKKVSLTSKLCNQQQTALNENSIKSKGYKQPVKKTDCIKNPILSSIENVHSPKVPNRKKKDSGINLERIPIWKRNLLVSKLSKKRSNVDVYDISLDEDFAFDNVQIKKKKIQSTRNKLKRNCEKKTCHPYSKSKKKKCSMSKPIDKIPDLEIDQILPPPAVVLEPIEADKSVISQASDENNFDNDVYVEQISLSLSPPNEIVQCIFPDPQSFEPQDRNKMYLSNLADELEKSFSFPKMTSTPGDTHTKTGMQAQKSKVISIADISDVPPKNSNCLTSSTPAPVSSEKDVLSQADEDSIEITLFESPEKTEAKERKDDVAMSPKKLLQINLFGEVLRTPSSLESSEDSVLMPKKAYHTPDNFKVHVSRTKRPVLKTKKQLVKSKQDLLVEQMCKHFAELEKTKLCIE